MRMMATNKRKNILIAALCAFIIQFFCMNSHAATSASTATKTVSTAAPAAVTASASAMASGSGSTGGGSGTMTPDLFTGTLSDRIPIEVAPGRKGMAPSLALSYQSNAGNGWVGVGWDLEVGAIERSTKNGVNYSGDEYVLHIGGSTIDLVHIYTNEFGASVTDEYRAKIESGFSRVKKLSSSEGSYWEVTDKSGTRYLYGQTAGSRQDNPADANRVFKWCLDKVEDTNGSYMSLNYEKTPEGKPYEGEIYLKQIDYAGNSNAGRTPTNYVHFYLESRNDAPVMYTTNFAVKTAYRLKTIEVRANGYPVKVYKLTYASSSSTSRSLLSSVQQYGNDATVDTVTGNITNEAVASKLPATVFDWQLGGSSFTSTWDSSQLLTSGTYLDENNRLWFTDVNGDGKADLLIRGSGNNINVKLSNGAGFSTTWDSSQLLTSGTYLGENNRLWFTDVNGDGKADLLIRDSGNNINVKLSNGAGFSTTWDSSQLLTSGTYLDENNRLWFTDVNGDGKGELVIRESGNNINVKLSNGAGFSTTWDSSQLLTSGTYLGENNRLWFTDVNGDGKADLLIRDSGNNINVKLSNGAGFSTTWDSSQLLTTGTYL